MDAPETPADSPLTLEQVMGSPFYGNLMAPEVEPGGPAFDFDLPILDPQTHRPSGQRIRLADFAGERPVALVFGSYS